MARPTYTGWGTVPEFHASRRESMSARARTMHPRVLEFVEWFGLDRLLETDASDKWARKEMHESFAAMLDAHESRSVATTARASLTPAKCGALNA